MLLWEKSMKNIKNKKFYDDENANKSSKKQLNKNKFENYNNIYYQWI